MVIRKRLLYILAAAVCVFVIWLLVDLVITSDKERIVRKTDALFAAVAEGDADGLMATVSPYYEFDGLTWSDWNDIVQGYFKLFGPTKVSVLRKKINVQGKLAAMDISIYARTTGKWRQSARSSWSLSWRKQEDEWQITKIKLISMNGRQMEGLPPDIRRLR